MKKTHDLIIEESKTRAKEQAENIFDAKNIPQETKNLLKQVYEAGYVAGVAHLIHDELTERIAKKIMAQKKHSTALKTAYKKVPAK